MTAGTHRRTPSSDKTSQSNMNLPYNRNRAGSTSARDRTRPEIRPLAELGDNMVNSPSPLKRSEARSNLLNFDQTLPGSPSVARTKRMHHHHIKKQISVDNFTGPGHRESPFGTPKPVVNPSIHTLASSSQRQQRVPHPLSRGSITSSRDSNAQENTKDHPSHKPRDSASTKRTAVDKFKLELQHGDTHFSTPEALKAVKPLATAFVSVGLLSKRGRNQEHLTISKPTPDTPCKRPTMIGLPNTPGTPGTPLGPKEPLAIDVNGKQHHMDDNALDDYLFYDNEGDSSFIYASSGSDFDGTPHTPTRSLFGLNEGLSEAERQRRKLSLFGRSPADDGGYFLHRMSELPSVPATRLSSRSVRSSPLNTDGEAMLDAFSSSQVTITAGECNIPSILEARFRNVQKLGLGEFSEVFVVEERSSHNKYAVKRSKTPFATKKERLRRQEEVSILAQIGRHEHIIQLQDSWEEAGHLFIQTDYCENGSLDVFLQELGRTARLDEFRVWKILTELALGVSFIHEQGFLHLDLKPANIFISFEGVLKIGDFGMSVEWPAPAHIEREGDREYIAPEVLSSGQYDKPVDIFSLGLIILEVAANIVLPDNGASWQKLRSGDLSDAPRLSSSSNESSVPSIHEPVVAHPYIGQGGLDRVVSWMLSPEPSARPTAAFLLNIEEVQWVNKARRAGAVIYEGDRGPGGHDFDIYMVNEEPQMDDDGEDWRMEM